jgi:hypothetical protein
MASCTCRCGNYLGDSADVLEASGGTRETAALIDSKLSTITNASSDHDASCIDRVSVKHLPRSVVMRLMWSSVRMSSGGSWSTDRWTYSHSSGQLSTPSRQLETIVPFLDRVHNLSPLFYSASTILRFLILCYNLV